MFTVLICDEHIIKDCHQKYHIYLKPLLDGADFAFCAWNVQGTTLDDALPGLREIIKHKKEWRAIIVNDNTTWSFEAVNKRNPFDFVDSERHNYSFNNFEEILNFRAEDEKTLDKALCNPLTRLSIWLCGSPLSNAPLLCYADQRDFINSVENAEEYYAKIDEMGLRSSEVEADRSREIKYRRLYAEFEEKGELFNPPQSVIAIAERAKNVDNELAELAWTNHTEFDYSQFYIDNLYPEKLRYLICDLSYIKEKQNENHYFNFLTLLLLLAVNDVPEGVLRSNRVYKLQICVDPQRVRALCNDYNSKLWATLVRIDDISKQMVEAEKQPVDKYTARDCFESDVEIEIDVVNRESRDNLKARYDGIGLSKDCPSDELSFWIEQYHSIQKFFLRFLREPRRAVKTATKTDFRAQNKIDDERASRLNEYQLEDVVYALEEEERDMISTSTSQLFDTARYTKMMQDADKEIRRGISQRMTKRKTMFVGIAAALAYLIGFLPLIFSNFNNSKSLSFSIVISVVVMVLFLLIGFITLFVLRKRLVNRFKHFNFVMSGILSEIEGSVSSFSKYLSHACNVMREFSVLNFSSESYRMKQNTLVNHKRMIKNKISEVNELFSYYIDPQELRIDSKSEPYDYDFTIMTEYEYDMPYLSVDREINFLQPGNVISVPLDFVNEITLTREELYD